MLTFFIIVIIALAVLTTVLSRHQPASPLFWLTPFALFYTASYSVSEVIDKGSYHPGTTKLLLMNVVGFVVALSAAWFWYRVPSPFGGAAGRPKVVNNKPFAFELPLFYVVCGVCCMTFVLAFTGGFGSKREVVDAMFNATSPVARIWVLFLMMAIRQMLLCAAEGRLMNRRVALCIVIAVLAWLLFGQREHLFGIGLVWLLVALHRIPSSARVAVFWGAIFAFALVEPTTQNLKSALIGGGSDNLRETTLLYPTPYSGTTRNIMVIEESDLGVSTQDVLRREFLRPFNVMGQGAQIMSMSQWYNQVARVQLGIEGTSGWGFSLIASGWLMGGYLGIAFIFLIFGTVIGLLYRLFHSSLFWGSIYIYIVPLSIYVLRQDLSYFFNSLFKHALIPMLFLALINSVLRPATDRLR